MSKAIMTVRVYELLKHGEPIMTGTVNEITKAIGRSATFIRSLQHKEKDGMRLIELGNRMQVYALYDEEEFVAMGTLDEIAETSGVDIQNLKFIRSNIAEERNLRKKLIALEGETVIVKRTHNAKFAPIPENDQEVEKPKQRKRKITVAVDKPLETTNWNINPYYKQQFEMMFKKWRA